MRVALFAKSKSRTQTTRSIARALGRAGHPVLAIHESSLRRRIGRTLARAWIVRRVRGFRPDLVLVHGRDVSPDVFSALAGAYPTLLFTPDCSPSPVRPERLGLAAHVDLLCTVAKGQVPELERAGVKRVAWLPEAHDPEVHFPVADASPRWRSDVAFIGKYRRNSRHVERGALVRAAAERFDLRLYGDGWEAIGLRAAEAEVFPEQYRQICRGAKVVLGRDWRDDCAGYFSNRTWFTLGCGGFLLTNYVPQLEDVFENHGHLVWYRSTGECLELLRHYLHRPESRHRIAERGHAFVREHRTYDHFVRDLTAAFEGRAPGFLPER